MKTSHKLRPRIRIMCGDDIAFGPGKAELLAHVNETGSLNQAAQRMNMSYMRAWSMVRLMNRTFKKPLVRCERGGSGGGGAQLTDSGREVLALYRQMEQSALSAIKAPWTRMRRLLNSAPD